MENVSMNDVSEPIFGMLFNSEQDAYDYYNSYGWVMGFSVRKHFLNKSKKDKMTITSRGFVYSKAGCWLSDKRDINTANPRAETRTDCQARMNICLVDDGKYKCCDFVKEHNHELHITSTIHMMSSQKNMLDIHRQEIDLTDDSGIRPRSTVELMGRQAGGIKNLSCLTQDVRNYLRTKRQRALTYGEAGNLMKYFVTQTRNNPSFTYSFQLDSEEQITNIFWADPKMIIDYAQFGDVVSFDTTFRTKKECMPFGLFTGFNHHRGCTVFRVDLLYDETVESFEWLFENGITHLGHMMKDGSKFLTDLKKCIYQYDVKDEFKTAWHNLLNEYVVKDMKRGNELKAEFDARNKMPRLANSMSIIQKQVRELYTPRIPECYILKRWTRGARTMVVNDSRGKEVEQDVNLDCTQRYKRICLELIQIASEASNTIEGYNLVKDAANELRLKLGNIRINPIDCPDILIFPDFSDNVYPGLRLKHKEKSTRGGRRLKS
ncbi:protein FAR1-RELATED SEQUENCE 5-like [Macadamia integrifolia]|uniref:protein FAR1-RELATED SEQUENCE 5-like n=1 Tax=Macadamia integrifolia TaxID=60698 RepID=UPI001C52CF15|nr:protein FAR1-RELATED SEQUENCE 5-like [Macadamia integrifolia]